MYSKSLVTMKFVKMRKVFTKTLKLYGVATFRNVSVATCQINSASLVVWNTSLNLVVALMHLFCMGLSFAILMTYRGIARLKEAECLMHSKNLNYTLKSPDKKWLTAINLKFHDILISERFIFHVMLRI